MAASALQQPDVELHGRHDNPDGRARRGGKTRDGGVDGDDDGNNGNNDNNAPQPEPLQIVKRRESVLGSSCGSSGRGGGGGGSSTRSGSGGTDSGGSVAEPPGGDAPLTVRKRRLNAGGASIGGGRVGVVAARKPRLSGSWTWGGGLAGVRRGWAGSVDDDADEDSQDKRGGPAAAFNSLGPATPRPLAGLTPPPAPASRTPSLESRSVGPARRFLPPSPPVFGVGVGTGGDPYARATTCLPFLEPRGGAHHNNDNSSPNHYRQPDPSVLVPCVTVTPDCRGVDAGARSFWAAVQVSTVLSRPEAVVAGNGFGGVWGGGGGGQQGRRQTFRAVDADELGLHQFGYLYDVKLEVLPVHGNSEVLEILVDKAAPTVLEPGARLLALAHIQLEPTDAAAASPGREPGQRHDSDELMRDLELQLGTTRTDYLRVCLTYRHSGFPHQKQAAQACSTTQRYIQQHHAPPGDTPPPSSPSASATVAATHRIETEVVATIERRNSGSLWSPTPAAALNPLLQVVASCWGVRAARDVMRRISARAAVDGVIDRAGSTTPAGSTRPQTPATPTPAAQEPAASTAAAAAALLRRPATAAPPSSPHRPLSRLTGAFPRPNPDHHQQQQNHHPEVNVPARRASLRRGSVAEQRAVVNGDRATAQPGTPDPAHKIWGQIRRASSHLPKPSPQPPPPPSLPRRGMTVGRRLAPGGLVASRVEGLQAQAQAQMRPQTRASAEPLGGSSSRLRTPLTTTGTTAGSSSRGRETERRREALLETAVRNRRSLGVDTLRSLVPSETDGTLGGGADLGARRQQQQQQQPQQREVVRRGSGKVKRESGGRWGWAGWW